MSESPSVFPTTHLDQFPRLPDEITDCGRFQRSIAATQPGGTLFVPPGEYMADSIQIHQSIQLHFSLETKLTATEKNRDILIVEGSRENTDYILKCPVVRGDGLLVLTEEPVGWSAGDMIVLTDDAERVHDKQQGINTEVHEIAWIERNKVMLRDHVRLPKAVSSKGMNLYRVHPIENVLIENLTYQLPEGSVSGRGLFMHMVRDVKVRQLKGLRGAGSGVQFQKAMHIHVEHFQFIQPQVTGSGQGYGVQFYGGCNHVVVRDGYTYECRHSVDLDGCFDAYVGFVIDYHAKGAAFVMSHNGCSSDIHFEHCKAYHSLGAGLVANSQGFADPLQVTFYNFSITNCEVIMRSSANACIYFYSPCKDVLIRDCKLSNISIKSAMGLSNAGIRVYPVRSEVLISNCQISGLRRGIALQMPGRLQAENDQSRVVIRDTRIQNCNSSILFHNGFRRRVAIYNLVCDQIASFLFELNGKGSFQEWVIDGLTLKRSTTCRFSVGKFKGTIRGMIRNIFTDHEGGWIAKKPTWSLTETDLYLNGDGETVMLQGIHTSSGKSPLPDGLVEGQRLTFLITKGKWTLHCGANMVLSMGLSNVTLDEQRCAITFIWRSGKWLQT